MSKESVLSRQILTYMVTLALIIIAIAILGSWLFYSFVLDYLPGGTAAGSEENMTMWDWLWLVTVSTISLMISLFLTVKLSSRILTPLNAVASSLKRISQGDLDARAWCASSQLGEINHLVNDFNEMAEKLQTLDIQRKSWNAAIAHELRTPVTILRGRLQGLVDGVFAPDPALFNNLLKQTEGLARLIEDLRVVSSDGGAGYTLCKSEIDLKDTLETALETFRPEFKRKQYDIHTELKTQRCICDPLRINQCLTVLFDNALHYSTSRKLIIKNGVYGKENYILIQDEGPGIPREFHEVAMLPMF